MLNSCLLVYFILNDTTLVGPPCSQIASKMTLVSGVERDGIRSAAILWGWYTLVLISKGVNTLPLFD